MGFALVSLNSSEKKFEKLNDEMRAYLNSYFSEPNQKFSEMIDRELTFWK
jgi:hypothetical protein